MNNRFFLTAAPLVLALSAVVTSCKHDIEYITPQEGKTMQYEAAFVQCFGMSIDSNNDWGFGDTHVTGGRELTRADEENAADKVIATGRVLCEDLGSSYDFDFNDIVFDAYIYKSGKIEIQVVARGGILPVSVAGVPITMKQMSNTGVDTDNFQTINITAEDDYSGYYLGLNGFIIGRLTIAELGQETPGIICYDRACSNCYQNYNITKPLVLQTGGYVKCNSCGRTYNLNDIGNISNGPAGRALYRYRVSYVGQTLIIYNG